MVAGLNPGTIAILGFLGAVVAALGGIGAALLGRQNKKLDEIHHVVNSNLDKMTAQRDEARRQRDKALAEVARLKGRARAARKKPPVLRKGR